jgi:hypothetical protein
VSTLKILVFGDVLIRKTDDLKYNGSGKRGKSTGKSDREKNFCKRHTYNLKFPVFFICLLKYIFFFLFDFYQLREIKLSFLREPNM